MRYVGATGPVSFDANGDSGGAALIWTVKGDALAVEHTLTIDDIAALFRQIDN